MELQFGFWELKFTAYSCKDLTSQIEEKTKYIKIDNELKSNLTLNLN